MKRLLKLSAAALSIIYILYLFILTVNSNEECQKGDNSIDCQTTDQNLYKKSKNDVIIKRIDDDLRIIHLSVVACGDRLKETLIMIKSATLLTRSRIHVHIFADEDLKPLFQQQLDLWPGFVREKLAYSLYPIQFPPGPNSNDWRKLFKPCASQRLFLPEILKHLDSLIYVDTDILFMRPIDDLWNFLNKFNSTQISAMAPEHEESTASWYHRFARHPYVPPYGINSGVMLMNVTRMLEADWLKHVITYYTKHRYDITWGDQDLINIFFHHFPEKLYQYPCHWNYRPDHCMYMSNCKSAEKTGISVIHGNRGVYHNDKQPIFKAIYEAIRDYKFGDDMETELLNKMFTNMKDGANTSCGKVSKIFTTQFAKQLEKLQQKRNEMTNKETGDQ